MISQSDMHQGGCPQHLLKKDLPPVAEALCLYPGGTIGVTQQEYRGATYITMQSAGASVAVIWEDWQKILPWIQEGYFSTPIFPAGMGGGQPNLVSTPSNPASSLYPLYVRTLEKLQELFPEDYPISPL